MSDIASTGYGIAQTTRLIFNGDDDKYELWEVKFLARLRLLKLMEVIDATDATVDSEKNKIVYAEMGQLLDDKSLSLVIRDAKDDGRKALKVLRDHYRGSSKPRIIGLYTELTSLVLNEDESIADYIIRAEKSSTQLKYAGETISDSLLVAMVMKGLPSNYKPFVTVITQRKEDTNFTDFKRMLRSYEENEKCQNPSSSGDSISRINYYEG